VEAAMMGRRSEQASLFYQFQLDDRVPKDHLLRRIDRFVTPALADIRERLQPYYSDIGRPSVDPELMIRMLVVGYCYGLRSERRLTQEVELHLAYRWFCRLDLDDRVPHHSTFSENRLNRFRESDILRQIFERVVMTAMEMGLVKGEGFAEIRDADGFVFVTGEYNWGVQPGLKNLTDHFLEEWFWRPAAIVSYSAGRVSGARAATAWHRTLSEMGMVDL
jgi:transposase